MTALLLYGTRRASAFANLRQRARPLTRGLSAQAKVIEEGTQQQTQDTMTTKAPVLGSFPHGPTISNKETVFDDIDRALGVSKPPDIEVILTDHMVVSSNALSPTMISENSLTLPLELLLLNRT